MLRPAGQRFRDRIEEDHTPGHVSGDDRVADAGQSDPQALMLREQLFFRLASPGDFFLKLLQGDLQLLSLSALGLLGALGPPLGGAQFPAEQCHRQSGQEENAEPDLIFLAVDAETSPRRQNEVRGR